MMVAVVGNVVLIDIITEVSFKTKQNNNNIHFTSETLAESQRHRGKHCSYNYH